MMDARIRTAEVVLSLVAIAIAVAFLLDGWRLEAGVFEPVGSGAVPNAVAAAIILMALVVLAGFARARSGEDADSERWGVAGVSLLLLTVYVTALALGLRYQWATLLYVPLAILAIAPDRRRSWPVALVCAGVLAFGLDYTFRYLLVTDLP